jgi:hypothetical protein
MEPAMTEYHSTIWKASSRFTLLQNVANDSRLYRRFSGPWRRSYRPGASIVNAPSRSMGKSRKNAISSRIFGISPNNSWVICGQKYHISPESYLGKFRKFTTKSRFFNFSPYFEMGRLQYLLLADRSDAIVR